MTPHGCEDVGRGDSAGRAGVVRRAVRGARQGNRYLFGPVLPGAGRLAFRRRLLSGDQLGSAQLQAGGRERDDTRLGLATGTGSTSRALRRRERRTVTHARRLGRSPHAASGTALRGTMTATLKDLRWPPAVCSVPDRLPRPTPHAAGVAVRAIACLTRLGDSSGALAAQNRLAELEAVVAQLRQERAQVLPGRRPAARAPIGATQQASGRPPRQRVEKGADEILAPTPAPGPTPTPVTASAAAPAPINVPLRTDLAVSIDTDVTTAPVPAAAVEPPPTPSPLQRGALAEANDPGLRPPVPVTQTQPRYPPLALARQRLRHGLAQGSRRRGRGCRRGFPRPGFSTGTGLRGRRDEVVEGARVPAGDEAGRAGARLGAGRGRVPAPRSLGALRAGKPLSCPAIRSS